MELIKIDGVIYKTENKIIDINLHEKEKEKLEKFISNIPERKKEPDKETLDLWNSLIPDITQAQRKLDEINSLLNEIKEIKEIKEINDL